MRRGDAPTDPGQPPETDPGPAPEAAAEQPSADPYNPPILNSDVAALLKGLNASRAPHPTPKEVPTTDGELTASWSAEAHEAPVAYPTPEPVPNIVLECTEEKPVAEIVARRPVDQMQVDTDPGPPPESDDGGGSSGGVSVAQQGDVAARDRSRAKTVPSLLLRRQDPEPTEPALDRATVSIPMERTRPGRLYALGAGAVVVGGVIIMLLARDGSSVAAAPEAPTMTIPTATPIARPAPAQAARPPVVATVASTDPAAAPTPSPDGAGAAALGQPTPTTKPPRKPVAPPPSRPAASARPAPEDTPKPQDDILRGAAFPTSP